MADVEKRHREAALAARFPSRNFGPLDFTWFDTGTTPGYEQHNRIAQALADAEQRGAASAKAEAQPAGTGWVSVGELPDSDTEVALIHAAHGWSSIAFGLLEFTDDSEGHGEPYWESTRGQQPINAFTHWAPLPPLPAPPEPRE